jgi:hypothetical protein
MYVENVCTILLIIQSHNVHTVAIQESDCGKVHCTLWLSRNHSMVLYSIVSPVSRITPMIQHSVTLAILESPYALYRGCTVR